MPATRRTFTAVSIALHWLVAAGLVGMLLFGMAVGAMTSGPEKTAAIQIHKSFGIIVGGLALVRLVWRCREGFPPPVPLMPRWEVRAARRMHEALLCFTVAMPLTGVLKSISYARPVEVFGMPFLPQLLAEKNVPLNEAVSLAHMTLGYLLAVLVLLHAAAALKHHFWDRDQTLTRMTRARRSPI